MIMHDHAISSLIEPKRSIDTQLFLMPSFPLDDGENAAVTFAGNLDAVFFLCDKLIQLGLIHVLFGNTRLVTTSALLLMIVRTEQLLIVDTYPLLDTISVNHRLLLLPRVWSVSKDRLQHHYLM